MPNGNEQYIAIFAKIEDDKYKFIPMEKKDIILNACIFWADEVSGNMIPLVIDEILDQRDQFKMFSANGCRYGMNGFYIMQDS